MQIKRVSALLALAMAVYVVGAGAQQDRISPHETVSATLAGKEISVTYGRPSIKGRKIMGGLVPYGRVWRTGADEATMLTTPVDLTIGGTAVAAGKYTLWTVPGAESWKLVINKETGQWGTKYDGAQDLARIDMKMSHLDQPVEEFTISLKQNGDGAADLILEWENTRVSIPLRAK